MACRVVLKSQGNNQLETMKAILHLGGIEIGEAKYIIENLPQILCEHIKEEEAKKICQEFIELGCEIIIEDEYGYALDKSYMLESDMNGKYELVLERTGTELIKTIKEVREATGYGLKQAKDIVDGAPQTIMTGLSYDEAVRLKRTLEQLGNKVSMKSDGMDDEVGEAMAEGSLRCPDCGGLNVKDMKSSFFGSLINSLTGQKYQKKCGDCGRKW